MVDQGSSPLKKSGTHLTYFFYENLLEDGQAAVGTVCSFAQDIDRLEMMNWWDGMTSSAGVYPA